MTACSVTRLFPFFHQVMNSSVLPRHHRPKVRDESTKMRINCNCHLMRQIMILLMMELIENTRSNVLAFLSSAFGKRRFKAVTEVLSYFQFSLLIHINYIGPHEKKTWHTTREPRGGTAIYGPYRYVPL